ncbi:MAG: hypothetical protein ACTSUF_07005 [Candidatus Heimdallarchaeaceae archaeon]
MKRKSMIMFLVLGAILAVSLSIKVSAQTNPLTITTAYYCDLDSDGKEDDIFANAVLSFDDVARTTTILVYQLTYPSGDVYIDYFVYTTTSDVINFDFYMLNTATQGGWYTFTVDAYVYRLGATYHFTDSLTFDPPDGFPDEPPDTWVSGSP